MGNDIQLSAKDSYSNMKRLCSALRVVSIVLFILLAIVDIALIVLGIVNASDGQALSSAIYSFLHGMMICTVFFVIILGLSDVIKGNSPFTAKQVRRLVIAGFIFLAIALIELAFPVDIAFDMAPASEAVIGVRASTTTAASNVDVAALLFSFASFCLSAIFKYGIILQQLSDETV